MHMIKNGETIKAKITIGINEGYNHNNERKFDFETYIQELAEQYALETITDPISFVIYPTKTVYSTSWGCPKGGEETYTMEATANPKFVKDTDQWSNNLISFIEELKTRLNQSTIMIEFQNVRIKYITD